MPAKVDDLYGTFGSVPTQTSSGEGIPKLNTRANAADFGGAIGEATSNLGEQTEKTALHFGQMATEAKVNDDYANKYIPAATQLRAQYDGLRGQDKIAGYDGYIKGLQDLNKQFTSAQPGIYGQQLMSGQINRHVASEISGARRELVQSQKEFSDKAAADMILANNSLAANNYNNPALVASVMQQNDNHVLMQFIDNGHDPNHPESQALIENAQKSSQGQMATGMINQAINSNDPQAANEIRANFSEAIPGYQKLKIDNTLHTQNIRQTGINTVSAITAGRPVPTPVGAPAIQVQALVADTAKNSDIDPNHALAVLRIESGNGQNLGERGTLGQDKESAGKSLEEQAKTLCDNLKIAKRRGVDVLGREPQPWETYAIYQQGIGGGPALLNADPNSKAVDVLSKFYRSPKDAISAINGNGGNITMSTGDFLQHIKQVYNDNARRANCDFGDKSPGQAIMDPHEQPGQTVQPGGSPVQDYLNFQNKLPTMLAQINSIPNYEVRDGVMRAFKEKEQVYTESAKAYTNVLVNKATQLSVDPKFVSMDQVPTEMQAALAVDHPDTLHYLQTRAEYNLARQGGAVTKDTKEYGPEFYESLKKVWNGEITSPGQLHEAVVNGKLYMAGYDKIAEELKKSTTPKSASEGQAKKLFYDYAKKQIIPFTDFTGENTQKFNDFYIQAEDAYADGIKAGKTSGQLLTSTSPDYIGKLITQYKPSQNKIAAGMANDKNAEGARLAQEIQTFNTMDTSLFPEYANNARKKLADPNITEEDKRRYSNTLLNLEIVAAKRGLARPRTVNVGPTVPMAE